MKRYQNLLMMIAVVVLIALPLWMVQKPAPGPDGKEVEIFKGADDQAKDVIGTLAPGYKPWFKPLMEPHSGEIGSLLFALQAALGAGFIGYYLGMSVTRAKYDKAIRKVAKC
jgi:cobalt/nickel transport protein